MGKKIVITDRVKPGKLYKFGDYVLVSKDDERRLLAWILSTAEVWEIGMFR